MTYKAIYRMFRPKTFEDVVGQQHIITTLKNQIKDKKISHAYLFSGTRGTGKTSTAKIFARAINCEKPNNISPCNNCHTCISILDETIMDVIEIDAASNNGVDHIREIKENVKYPPSKGKFKVYIIDEVHMLSTGAFNALLKTLEEPPSFVVFILATTEPHKLPATILSRCQRYDFKPINTTKIAEHLKMVCESINVNYEEKAINSIAISGKGSVRDSLSILEQCISFSEGILSYDKVLETLGIVSDDVLIKLLNCIYNKEVAEGLSLIQELIMEGKDIQLLIKEIIKYMRYMLLKKVKVSLEEMNLSIGDHISEVIDNNCVSEKELVNMIYILTDVEAKMRYSSQPQILLEAAIVNLCNLEKESITSSLMDRIGRLESLLLNERDGTKNIEEIHIDGKTQIKDNRKIATNQQVKANEIQLDKNANFEIIKEKWPEVLEELKKNKKAQIKAFLVEGEIKGLDKGYLIIAFKDGYGFHREALDKEETKEYISSLIQKTTNQRVRIKVVMDNEAKVNSIEENIINKLKEKLPEDILQIIE